jgi:glucosamine--fructose-6-phosphate aminotransferase (isomerizing)
MCGIVGYVGPKKVVPVIIEGLRRLEYRGYDSAGIAVGKPGNTILEIRRAPGKLGNLEEVLREHPLDGTFGIGHTRWAGPRRRTRIPIATARGVSSWCTTASSKTTWS